MEKKFETIIGLEVHVQLKTETKMFCGCANRFGDEPNTLTCPVCIGLPGVLPVINKKAIEYGIKIALALNCSKIAGGEFARKNYFYPDLPKGYQISQYDKPLAEGGNLTLNLDNAEKKIRITRVHLEEDAGKLIHSGSTGQIRDAEESLVDLNRAGVPLIEIVSEPDIRSSLEASEYLISLRSIMRYLGVSDCNMEEGSLRCDANISVRASGDKKINTKVEIKNLNSFKHVREALEYEEKRQIQLIETGQKVIHETRLYDPADKITLAMRSKEEINDYRYFPEPDLLPLLIKESWIQGIQKSIPELPSDKAKRFVNEYNLPQYDAIFLSNSKDIASYYESAVKTSKNPKTLSNLMLTGSISQIVTINIEESPVPAGNLAELANLIDRGEISATMAKIILDEMIKTGKTASDIIKEKNFKQITSEDEIGKIVDGVIAENQKSVQDFLKGKENAIGFLVGQAMKKTQGKANPQIVNKIIKEKLSNMK